MGCRPRPHYPAIDAELLEDALLYTSLKPRRSRPRTAQWQEWKALRISPVLTLVNILTPFPDGIRVGFGQGGREPIGKGSLSSPRLRVLESGATLELQSDRGGEPRWIAIGMHPTTGKVVAVVYAMREARYRIISARRARKHEEQEYRTRISSEGPEEEQGREARSGDER